MRDQAQSLRDLVHHSSKKSSTRIISIASGKGGVGKTNLSVNLAIGYASQGEKVILVDADLGLANANILLGLSPEYDLYHLLKRQKSIEEIIIQTDYGIDLIPGASGLSRISNLSEEEREFLISNLEKISYADVIIIDTSAGISENVTSFVFASHETIVVTSPEPTAITDAYGLIKILASSHTDSLKRLHLVVNQAHSVSEAKSVATRISNIAARFLNIEVHYLGFVFSDPAVPKAVCKQRPFTIYAPQCKATACIVHLLRSLDRELNRQQYDFKKFLNRLLVR